MEKDYKDCLSDYNCDECGRAIEEGEEVLVQRKCKVVLSAATKLWELVNADNVLEEVICKNCQ